MIPPEKPALVMPFHDPDGSMFRHLGAILPNLKAHFDRAYLTIPDATAQGQPENVRKLEADDFFWLYPIASAAPVGDHFGYLYQHAADDAHPEQILHLCYPDRLSFALRTDYREAFLADIDSLLPEHLPLIFHRSDRAWATHPKNYLEIETFASRMGQILFGKWLDYGWCHLVLQAKHLRPVMPKINNPELSMVAEMILHLQDDIHTREVDWLAWEDPFIFERDADELKRERENNLEETQKRLSYVLPIVELLTRFAMARKVEQCQG